MTQGVNTCAHDPAHGTHPLVVRPIFSSCQGHHGRPGARIGSTEQRGDGRRRSERQRPNLHAYGIPTEMFRMWPRQTSPHPNARQEIASQGEHAAQGAGRQAHGHIPQAPDWPREPEGQPAVLRRPRRAGSGRCSIACMIDRSPWAARRCRGNLNSGARLGPGRRRRRPEAKDAGAQRPKL